MKKLLFFLLAAMLPLMLQATVSVAVQINGIRYNLDTEKKTAEVEVATESYTGTAAIRETVTYNKVEYSVTSISANAFSECDGLTAVTIPNSVTTIGANAFYGCDELTSVTIGNGVTSIGANAFAECYELTSVTIPNSVTSIDAYAFSECYELTSVTIPSSVTSVGYGAFDGTGWYNNQKDGIVYVGLVAYRYKGKMPVNTEIVLKDGTTGICDGAFSGCSGLTSITIPNSVTSIGDYAFAGTGWYDNQEDGIVYVGLMAYKYKGTMPVNTKIVLKDGTMGICDGAFSGCRRLTAITIPNSVTSIGSRAFSGCSGLTSLTIPNSVTSIGDRAFEDLSSLTSVTIGVRSIGDRAFEDLSSLTSVTIGNGVTSIGSRAFSGCSGLTSLTIPNSVTTIGADAFFGCDGLTAVTIGNGVTSIGSGAFSSCYEISDVYCHAEKVPVTNSSAFDTWDIKYSATLHVPAASIGSYSTTAPWSSFGKIVALEGDTPETPQCATPTIAYNNGKLQFSCETEGAEFVSEITDADIKKHYNSTVQLGVTYHISVVAMATGYTNSEPATATLCWIDYEPKTEGIANSVTEVKARPVLIQSNGGMLTVSGLDEQQQVSVYNMAGMMVGTATATEGTVTIDTSLRSGETAIVKIGNKSIKIMTK